MVSIGVVLAVLVAAFSYGVLSDNAFGQEEEKAGQVEQRQNMRERFRNMSPEEREKFRTQMEERRKRFENMSDEERQKLRDQMRERYGSRSRALGYDQQLESIKTIEEQLARLKAAVETASPEKRSRLRELPQEEREKVREKMMTAMRERYRAIRAMEQELARLRGPERRPTESQARLSELREIHKLAVKEKATQTADRLDKLIMAIQRRSAGRTRTPREDQPRQRRERPVRRENRRENN